MPDGLTSDTVAPGLSTHIPTRSYVMPSELSPVSGFDPPVANARLSVSESVCPTDGVNGTFNLTVIGHQAT